MNPRTIQGVSYSIDLHTVVGNLRHYPDLETSEQLAQAAWNAANNFWDMLELLFYASKEAQRQARDAIRAHQATAKDTPFGHTPYRSPPCCADAIRKAMPIVPELDWVNEPRRVNPHADYIVLPDGRVHW